MSDYQLWVSYSYTKWEEVNVTVSADTEGDITDEMVDAAVLNGTRHISGDDWHGVGQWEVVTAPDQEGTAMLRVITSGIRLFRLICVAQQRAVDHLPALSRGGPG